MSFPLTILILKQPSPLRWCPLPWEDTNKGGPIDYGGGVEERVARVEGRVEEVSKRIDDLRNDMHHRFEGVDKRFNDLKWEVRIWFIVLIALITVFTFLKG
jgi:hypothetical protein